MRAMTRAPALFALLALAACGGSRPAVGPVRFHNTAPVWVVDDRKDVARTPEERDEVLNLKGFDISIYRRITRALESRPPRRALGINSLGEVPNSTWFENRIGVRDVPLAEIEHGPGDGKGPDLSKPLQVVRGKTSGATAGFTAEDASGARWLVKFEYPDHPVAESATDIVVQRILWMAGYHVSENHVAYLRRDQIALADDAKIKDDLGRSRRMTSADLERTLARARPGTDGRYRVLASKFLPGKPLGGWPQEGVRKDDPNDAIPHERRRELRGLKTFAAWLQHTDFKEMGTLDMWQDDPLHEGRHIVMHYLVDYGNSLGVFGRWGMRPEDGHTETLDSQYAASMFTFGLWKRPWEGTAMPDIRGVGAYDVEHYDPIGFTAFAPYIPFLDADDVDAFWAVRIMLRFTPEQLRAALVAGQYDDPRAIDYILGVLIGRQKKTARIYLSRVSPADEIEVVPAADSARVCFVDLLVRHELEAAATYRARSFDRAGAPLGAEVPASPEGDRGRVCSAPLQLGGGTDAYTIVRLDVVRGGRRLPPVEAHIARDPAGLARLIGIERALPGER
jgi:hypothetical protein